MPLYELVCLDFDRTRTVTLEHDHLIPSATYHDLLAAVEENLLPVQLPALHAEWRRGRLEMRDLATALRASPAVQARLQAQLDTNVLTYSDVLDVIVGLLESHAGFRKPAVGASLTRLGHAVLE